MTKMVFLSKYILMEYIGTQKIKAQAHLGQ